MAGSLQPCQGEPQALSRHGVQDGEEGQGASWRSPTSLSPETHGRVRVETSERQERAARTRAVGSAASQRLRRRSRSRRLRRNLGLCSGVAKGQWGGTSMGWKDSHLEFLGLLACQAFG